MKNENRKRGKSGTDTGKEIQINDVIKIAGGFFLLFGYISVGTSRRFFGQFDDAAAGRGRVSRGDGYGGRDRSGRPLADGVCATACIAHINRSVTYGSFAWSRKQSIFDS
jgi:hypothetical protein